MVEERTKIILVGGDLASGKSTFAHQFSARHQIICLTKDRIKEILADSFGFENRKENYHLSQTTFKLLYYSCERALESKVDVLLESNFRQYEVNEIEELVKKYNADLISVVFYGEPNELFRRYNERIKQGDRHIAHQSEEFNSVEEFKALLDKMHLVKFPGRVMYIDNTELKVFTDKNSIKSIDDFVFNKEAKNG